MLWNPILKEQIKKFSWEIGLLIRAYAKTLSPKETTLLVIFIGVFTFFSAYLSISFWLDSTELVPEAGGEYRETIIGSPSFINPVLALTDEADRDLVALTFSGLMKYNEKGELKPDIAREFEISDDGKTYTFTLRNDVYWHDGEQLSVHDVLFTIALIQDSRFGSPLRINWQGVTAEQENEEKIILRLTNPYAPFIENTTVGILPQHIWLDIEDNKFPRAEANLKPIGTGPFRLTRIKKDSQGTVTAVTLERNENYYGKEPLLEKLSFTFVDHEAAAVDELNKKAVDGISFISPFNLDMLRSTKRLNLHPLTLSRYYALFFNQSQSEILSSKEVRRALVHSTNKTQIVDELLSGYGNEVTSPITKGLLGYDPEIAPHEFSQERAREILEAASWIDTDGDGVREKEDIPLELDLLVVESQELPIVADTIAAQWEEVGVRVTIEVLRIGEIEARIRGREYQILLFGEALGLDPDPFSFWHSSQKKDPGLNLALYSNKRVDELLEQARQSFDSESREEKYREFQKLIAEDIPAIFLYSPDYLYPVSKRVMGISVSTIVDPSKRFSGIENWYINTKRVWK